MERKFSHTHFHTLQIQQWFDRLQSTVAELCAHIQIRAIDKWIIAMN